MTPIYDDIFASEQSSERLEVFANSTVSGRLNPTCLEDVADGGRMNGDILAEACQL